MIIGPHVSIPLVADALVENTRCLAFVLDQWREEYNKSNNDHRRQHGEGCGIGCRQHIRAMMPRLHKYDMLEQLFWVCLQEQLGAELERNEALGYRTNDQGESVAVACVQESRQPAFFSITISQVPSELAALMALLSGGRPVM